MLKIILFICFVTNCSVIYCNEHIENVNVTIEFREQSKVCTVERSYYNLTAGTTIRINIATKNELRSSISSYVHTVKGNSFYSGFSRETTMGDLSQSYMINGSYLSDYELKFKFNVDNKHLECTTDIHYEISDQGFNAGRSMNDEKDKILRIIFIVGVLAVVIIIAEGAVIFYFKSKVKTLDRHNNMIKLKEEGEDTDAARYSTNPKKKDKKLPAIIPDDNRQSEIYEVPDITIGAPPPLPPGLPTSRSDLTSNTSTLKMPHSQPNIVNSYPTFPRAKQPLPESVPKLSVADRPPLELPQEEIYTEAEEENLYEPPPLLQKSPVQKPISQPLKEFVPPQKQFQPPQKLLLPPQKPLPPPQKPLPPAQNRLSPPQIPLSLPQKPLSPLPRPRSPPLKPTTNQTKALQEKIGMKLPMDAFKPPVLNKAVKPPISQAKPKESSPPRNKGAVQLPVRPIPASKPQPTVKPKPPAARPKTPPVSPTIAQQVQFFNEHRNDLPHDSSDEDEWTYEHLYNI